VQDSCSAECDEDGRLVRYHGVLRDVTKQRELEEQLRQAQKLEAVGRIAGGVAHDFNNLLMGIEALSAVLAAQIGAEDAKSEDVAEIRRLCRQGGQLTRKLLAFSRQQVLAPEVLDLNTLVRDVGAFLTRVLGENIEQETRLTDELWPVRADSGQLEQVLVNLAVNARDAMPGGGRLTLETGTARVSSAEARAGELPGEYVRLVVSDTGEGMDPEIRQRIFEPFFTTKPVGRGSGLGLAIVYGIVRQSGGFIRVESTRGQGTRFEIFLPRHDERPPEQRRDWLGAPAQRCSETVLLVEDEITVRQSLKRLLEAQGYTVLEAGHGEMALDVAANHRGPIDVLVSDVVMPGMNGPDLARELATRRPAVRVLFISGYVELENVGDIGRAPLLEKPFRPAALLRKLRDVLETESA
jgi:nitrogen-specific signal transduction histidine kinase/CheY-like chemotaxis protein